MRRSPPRPLETHRPSLCKGKAERRHDATRGLNHALNRPDCPLPAPARTLKYWRPAGCAVSAPVEADAAGAEVELDEVGALAGVAGAPGGADGLQLAVAEVVQHPAGDVQLEGGVAGQVEVDRAGVDVQGHGRAGAGLAEAEGDARRAGVDLDTGDVELLHVEVGGDRAGVEAD